MPVCVQGLLDKPVSILQGEGVRLKQCSLCHGRRVEAVEGAALGSGGSASLIEGVEGCARGQLEPQGQPLPGP